MTIYAESSAVLAWLLDEPDSAAIGSVLDDDAVVTSALTLVECDRVLLRTAATHAASTPKVALLRRTLGEVAAMWSIQAIDAATIERARQPFPDDAIRALDAIHLASALTARSAIGDLDVLSLDDRFRRNAAALGFRLLPT